ncbi:hypothetical protein DEJ16_12550 [Curtobacterium sp. MCJR17_055]|uniref:hypothetical protein n=1 Tax=unclassified Curtobacterium TaxID=257496 RepID=UPI000D9ABE53|nr:MULTISPECIES: hypothetical protein [unclassified Curtobacterium]PYY34079.1 hypothetical protein DEI87_09975 [Curtobacterium sp. MCBD17_029]PYY53929.1 hypothetical protein DEJ16_12550 [Curtobacterium sp. MCJR17_055]PYY59184.1 hypothetical protein DEJ26_09265 [Curtobacterium sp. MCPF17_015]WIB34827.1 hypothetical protein DEJ15_09615 [Curtobacterium sp. MCJR17_043]
MELITDVRRADWLVRRLQASGTVAGTVGGGFDGYARVLHPLAAFREDRSVLDEHGDAPVLETSTWRWSDVAARTGRTVDAGVSWSALSASRDEDVLFDDGWRVEPPVEGWLDPRLLAALTSHLSASTATPLDLVAAVWDGWGDLSGGSTLVSGWQDGTPDATERARAEAEAARLRAAHQAALDAVRRALAVPRLHLTHREHLLVHTTVADWADPAWTERAEIADGVPLAHTPQLLWPEDHAWVLATEIDCDSTLVAGTRRLVDAIVRDHRFEAYEVDPADGLR